MPPIFFTIPTANPAKCSATFARWKARGYATAALTDGDTPAPANCDVHLHVLEYRGWAAATNLLMRHVLEKYPEVQIVIGGGDDIDCDPHADPQQVAREFVEHFGGTLGVLQPTGDDFGIDASGRCAAERICGSPWIGREFAAWAYNGQGPFCDAYGHFFTDEELHDWTLERGILWQRKDLTQLHHHPTRTGEPTPDYMVEKQAGWARDEATFRARKSLGFPSAVPV